MRQLLQHVIRDEHGAVTVDWVVLTAAIVGLGIAVGGIVSSSVAQKSEDVGASISDVEVGAGLPEPE